MTLLLSPHNDDATLFASFIIQQVKPKVVTCLDSYIQPSRGYHTATWEARRIEDADAMCELGLNEISFLGVRDDLDSQVMCRQLRDKLRPLRGHYTKVYAPAIETAGHNHHNLVGQLAREIWGEAVVPYLTYTTAGKSEWGQPIPIDDPIWLVRKLRALACYGSQIAIDNCRPHFTRSLSEYIA